MAEKVAKAAALARLVRPSRWRLGIHLSERRILLLVGDLAVISAALWAALALRSVLPGLHGPLVYGYRWHWWLLLAFVWGVVAEGAGKLYDLQRASRLRTGPLLAAGAALLVSIVYLVIPVISAPLTRSRLAWFLFAAFASVGELAWRWAYIKVLVGPGFARRALIVGAGKSGEALARALQEEGCQEAVELVGFVDDKPSLQGRRFLGRCVLGTSRDLERLVMEQDIHDIVVAITDVSTIREELMGALVRCWMRGATIVPMPVYYEIVKGAIPVDHLGHNLLALSNGQQLLLGRLWKWIRRVIDVVVGAAGLLGTWTIAPLIALIIRLDSKGPILYVQERVGHQGRVFRLYKFRTMYEDAERPGEERWALENDPRITRVGRVLRKLRIDELPQFYNVLRGDMSLIGPRPERPKFVHRLSGRNPYYQLRHAVRPGITGWAQVCLGYTNTIEDGLRKLEYDLYYIKHMGPVLDLVIALRTLRVLLTMEGH